MMTNIRGIFRVPGVSGRPRFWRRRWWDLLAVLVATIIGSVPALARDHFVAASGASVARAPDGSRKAPWPGLYVALRDGDIRGGDRVVLAEGTHGRIYIPGIRFDQPVEIVAEVPGKTHVEGVQVANSRNLIFRGLNVWPRSPPDKARFLISTKADAEDISFIGLDIRGREDAPVSYMGWSKEDWIRTWRSDGVRLDGPRNHILDSRITGVASGIVLIGRGSSAIGNHVEGFSADAIRGLGDDSVYARNRVENCFAVDKNHDDAFQSWAPFDQPSAIRKISGVRIEANAFLEWTGPADHPLRCILQGIGLFDGAYENFVIRNNIVSVRAYHGIAVYGGRNVQIVNNTVVQPESKPQGYPWILLKDHKEGYPASGNLIANNMAMSVTNQSSDKAAIQRRTNLETRYPMRYYRDVPGGDFRLRSDSNILDAANPAFAPETDIDGTPRPRGAGPDFGAYEMP